MAKFDPEKTLLDTIDIAKTNEEIEEEIKEILHKGKQKNDHYRTNSCINYHSSGNCCISLYWFLEASKNRVKKRNSYPFRWVKLHSDEYFKEFIGRYSDKYLENEYIQKFMNSLKKLNKEDSSSNDEKTKKKQKKCFVVTATMGDANHPYVRTLQSFRDLYLVQTTGGKLLMEIYNIFGPKLARAIENNKNARNLMLIFIVRPSVWLVNKLFPDTIYDPKNI